MRTIIVSAGVFDARTEKATRSRVDGLLRDRSSKTETTGGNNSFRGSGTTVDAKVDAGGSAEAAAAAEAATGKGLGSGIDAGGGNGVGTGLESGNGVGVTAAAGVDIATSSGNGGPASTCCLR